MEIDERELLAELARFQSRVLLQVLEPLLLAYPRQVLPNWSPWVAHFRSHLPKKWLKRALVTISDLLLGLKAAPKHFIGFQVIIGLMVRPIGCQMGPEGPKIAD